MEQDLVNAEIPGEDIAALDSSIVLMKSKLPFLVSLSSDEKASIFKVGEIYKPFLQKAAQTVNAHPEIMPRTFNIEGFMKDYNLYTSLGAVLAKLNELVKAMDDTVTAAGSDALISSLEIYSAVKDHVNKIPGLNILYDDMKVYFPRKRSSQNKSSNQNQ